jgi:hypothetical protein
VSAEDRGERLGVETHLGCEVSELMKGRILTDEGELARDDANVESPHVFEDATNPAGGVAPSLTRSTRSVSAASKNLPDS